MSERSASADNQVQVVTRDLVFRSKLHGMLEALGWRATPGVARRAVIELGDDVALERVRALCASGATVIAFAPHVDAVRLRAAREAGAVAVPNSHLEPTVREVLGQAEA